MDFQYNNNLIFDLLLFYKLYILQMTKEELFLMTKEELFFFKDCVFPEHAKSVHWKGKCYSKEDIIKIKDIIHKINKV